MTAFGTYCSAEKRRDEDLLPAVERYQSDRIGRIYSAALAAGVGFLILSGEYGLLGPRQMIPYYDHLLRPEEVEQHVERVARQWKQLEIDQFIFFSLPLSEDEKLSPYLEVLRKSCDAAKVRLTIVWIDFQ